MLQLKGSVVGSRRHECVSKYINAKQGDAEKEQLRRAKTSSLDEYKSLQKSFSLSESLKCFMQPRGSFK